MKNLSPRIVGAAVTLGGFAALATNAFAFDATSTDTIFGGFLDGIGSNLTNNLPSVLAIVGGLIGLGILIRYVKRHIGKK